MLPRFLTDSDSRERATAHWFAGLLETACECTDDKLAIGRYEADQMGYDLSIDLNKSSHHLPIQLKCLQADETKAPDIHNAIMLPCTEMLQSISNYEFQGVLPPRFRTKRAWFNSLPRGQGGAVLVFTWSSMVQMYKDPAHPDVIYYTDFFILCAKAIYRHHFNFGSMMANEASDLQRIDDILLEKKPEIDLPLNSAFIKLRNPAALLFAPQWFQPSKLAWAYQTMLIANEELDPMLPRYEVSYWQTYGNLLQQRLAKMSPRDTKRGVHEEELKRANKERADAQRRATLLPSVPVIKPIQPASKSPTAKKATTDKWQGFFGPKTDELGVWQLFADPKELERQRRLANGLP